MMELIDDALMLTFSLTDTSTSIISREVCKRFAALLKPSRMICDCCGGTCCSDHVPTLPDKKRILLQCAFDGNIKLLKYCERFYGKTHRITKFAGMSGIEEIVVYCMERDKTKKSTQSLLVGAISGKSVKFVLWCIEKYHRNSRDCPIYTDSTSLLLHSIESLTLDEVQTFNGRIRHSFRINQEIMLELSKHKKFDLIPSLYPPESRSEDVIEAAINYGDIALIHTLLSYGYAITKISVLIATNHKMVNELFTLGLITRDDVVNHLVHHQLDISEIHREVITNEGRFINVLKTHNLETVRDILVSSNRKDFIVAFNLAQRGRAFLEVATSLGCLLNVFTIGWERFSFEGSDISIEKKIDLAITKEITPLFVTQCIQAGMLHNYQRFMSNHTIDFVKPIIDNYKTLDICILDILEDVGRGEYFVSKFGAPFLTLRKWEMLIKKFRCKLVLEITKNYLFKCLEMPFAIEDIYYENVARHLQMRERVIVRRREDEEEAGQRKRPRIA